MRSLKLVLFLILICFTTATVTAVASSIKKERQTTSLPIIMYHSVLKDKKRAGKYIITPEELENDFKYIKENGYTCVLSDDLIQYTKGGSLPSKPIMITFDDGHLNNLTNVLPLLEKYDLKAIISIVGSYSEASSHSSDHNPNYSYLSYDDIKTLISSGRIEIANHSYDLHKLNARVGCSIIKGEDIKKYQKMLKSDLEKTQQLLEKNVSYTPTVFTYPFGSCCSYSKDIIKELNFKLSLGCAEQVNIISRDTKSLYCLGRFNRESGIDTARFMSRFEKQ